MEKILTIGALSVLLMSCGGDNAPAEKSTSTSVATIEPTDIETSEQEATQAPEPVVISPEKAFRACAVCHSVADPNTPKGKIQLAGPNLFGIYNAPSARLEKFTYSSAMREANLKWNEKNLDAFIEKPSTFMRGNRMAYVGEKSPEKRAAIIEYLKQQK